MLISLDKSKIFEGLSSVQLADLLEKGQQTIFESKSILFHQGDLAKRCYLVHRGRLKLTLFSEQGKEVILRYIGCGELAAAIAVLRNQPYPATAECIDETEVTAWDKTTILALIQQYPAIAINLLGVVFDRIDDVQHRYLEVCSEQVDQRIARTLLRLMRRAGIRTAEGIHIDIPLSRQNIADYSGTTLHTVSRILSSWEKKGWIKSGREKIIIKDPHALVVFSEGDELRSG
ncbi:Crp/Fnr family transcriptional regulator [Desulforhopalus sp. IMCC35007]|uniref:Crp/Fnr family transcriptional regulator n=1 Tax=Desulforhopalus sp. IMCC35007 TaxID=2569543 RepID=UPI0010AECD01|nr:Crp/Fnr family transcriptional regulator [Desulforhopalus sp. IMCC35007]TKB09699.1 Crp/Fnr family transcriptional regulator [Desulforhopalus sp. IMCC35007]